MLNNLKNILISCVDLNNLQKKNKIKSSTNVNRKKKKTIIDNVRIEVNAFIYIRSNF